MAERTWTPKDPGETKDYTFDWEDVLEGDVIFSSVWSVVSVNQVTLGTQTETSTTTTVWVSGGTSGQTVKLQNTIVTAATPPRTFVRTRPLEIRNP